MKFWLSTTTHANRVNGVHCCSHPLCFHPLSCVTSQLIAGSFTLIISLMIATFFVVYKMGAISLNE